MHLNYGVQSGQLYNVKLSDRRSLIESSTQSITNERTDWIPRPICPARELGEKKPKSIHARAHATGKLRHPVSLAAVIISVKYFREMLRAGQFSNAAFLRTNPPRLVDAKEPA